MSFDLFLSPPDASRLARAMERFFRASFTDFALTGSLALESNLLRLACPVPRRSLNDLDLVVESFASIPPTLARGDWIVRHLHPAAPQGKLLLQLVDPAEALRIDIFRACGDTLRRTRPAPGKGSDLQVVSLEDLAARGVCHLLDLRGGIAVPVKHAQAFCRYIPVVDAAQAEAAWLGHRRPADSATFREAAASVSELVHSRADLLGHPPYSQDVSAICPRCLPADPFRLAPASQVLSILGYC